MNRRVIGSPVESDGVQLEGNTLERWRVVGVEAGLILKHERRRGGLSERRIIAAEATLNVGQGRWLKDGRSILRPW